MKQKKAILLGLLLSASLLSHAQTADYVVNLRQYFAEYSNPEYDGIDKIKVEDIRTDGETRTLRIILSDTFGHQPFRPATVANIYGEVKRLLPAPFNTYDVTICSGQTPIEQLIPTSYLEHPDTARTYRRELFKGNPWVTNLNQPFQAKKGLQGRHLCVWASHGKYFSHSKQEWLWQRPRLFCTTEDIFTQTFVIPYVIPMLQNAGAVVFTPRERDWQKHEAIIDNDCILDGSRYEEHVGTDHWQDGGVGFAHRKPYYVNGENPFEMGTYREIEATQNKRQVSEVYYIPDITEEGDYAVYVSYKTLPNSINDALYTVRHGGVPTQIRVNQQMGGSTWVYLGTFHFDMGKNQDNCIILSNLSSSKGVVTADAVRIGGGMGNIVRFDEEQEGATPLASGLPRCLEAARYTAQWSGFPDSIYSPRGNDDYSDDINVRPFTENFLARGSNYLPGDSGLCVPLEMSVAFHSDAGYHTDNTLVGSLGIYTTGFYDDLTAAGLSRLVSRDLTDMVMTQVTDDVSRLIQPWSRRQMFDRNYGETRDPQFPAIILEMLSHQNWADMVLAHDPYFKFTFSRAVYKGILRYLSTIHNRDYVVQPLPVASISAQAHNDKNKITVHWTPRVDPLEESARPDGYIIYIKEGDADFDNGHYISSRDSKYEIEVAPGLLYSFRVQAVNDGGASMMSDVVCAAVSTDKDAPEMLLVDGFQRLASPQPFDTDIMGGFDMETDPGVIDVKSPGYCGQQLYFGKDGYGKETANGFGMSGNELEGMILAGNTHDYTFRHARDIMASRPVCAISSCTADAIGDMDLRKIRLADVILGAQKDDGYSLTRRRAFTPQMRSAISQLTRQGASILVSGAFVGSDMRNEEDQVFTSDCLKYTYVTTTPTDSICQVVGLGNTAIISSRPNEQSYWVRSTDVIQGLGGAFSTMKYAANDYSAAIAYPGTDYRVMVFGFPLDCITDGETRRSIINTAVGYLLQ